MNHFVPDWNVEDGSRSLSDLLPQTSHRKSTGPDNELMELLWRNGHVVMQSQNHRKSPSIEDELKQTHKPEQAAKCGGAPANSIQEDDNASWFQYALDDSLEKEFYTEFLHGMPIGDGADDKLNNNEAPMAGERLVKLGNNGQSFTGLVPKQPTISLEDAVLPKPPVDSTAKHQSFIFGGNTMLPSKPNTDAIMQNNSSGNATRVVNFSHFSRPLKPDIRLLNQQSANIGSDGGGHLELGESSSMMSIRLSACGSNQVQNQFDPSYNMSNDARDSIAREAEQDMLMALPCGRVQTDPYETTVTSSSGGSGCSLGRIRPQGASNQSHKRKGRDVEELESLSEEGEDEFIEAKKPTQRPTTSRRSRAAEVHNLSERRRRDKINEKMRALQELIPHCNKSDKASMLDEAIEYLKSLQLQVQIMWMGSGMAPMMFPGVQQYMPRIDMGMGHVPLLSRAMPSGFPVSQASPTISPANFPNQMQNVHFNEQYARFLGLHHMQPSPQAMSLYAYGSHTTASNQMAAAANATVLPTTNGARPKNVQNGQPGKGGAYSRGF